MRYVQPLFTIGVCTCNVCSKHAIIIVCLFIESTCRCSRVREGGKSALEDGSFAGISGSTSMELSSVITILESILLLLFFYSSIIPSSELSVIVILHA